MKRLLVIPFAVASMACAHAQSAGMSHGRWEENNRSSRHTEIAQDNEYANTEIVVENRMAAFADLPDMPKATWAIVTDANGEVITQKRVTPTNNSMSLRMLSRGELYYVTLIYRNKSKKGFVLHP